MRTKLLILGVGVLAFGLTACSESTDSMTGPELTATSDAANERTPATDVGEVLDGRSSIPTIAGIAASNPDFSILVAALDAAGLVETFDGRRHFTVFAPTNDAFVALLGDLGLTAEELLADTDLLTAVLQFHVTRGDRNSTSVLAAGQVRMLNGQFAYTSVQGGAPFIENAQITGPDIRASNGIIHVIDAVLLP